VLDNNISGLILLGLTLVVQLLGIIINCRCNPYFLKQCNSDIIETLAVFISVYFASLILTFKIGSCVGF
jgi:hypothetical protein